MRGAVCCLAVCAAFAACLAVDPALDAECQDWIVANQKDLVILNQVAAASQISDCQQFCKVASVGRRPDTRACKSLCEHAGGHAEFASALNMRNGMAGADEICFQVLANQKMAQAAANNNKNSHIVSLLEIPSAPVQRRVGIRGDMTVQGTLSTSILTSPVGDVKVSGQLNVMSAIETTEVTTAFMKADAGVNVRDGIKSKREQLVIKGRIDADAVTSGTLQASFLEIGGVLQWALHSLEDFDEVGTHGWSHGDITECGGQRILGGHCVEKGTADLSKTFGGLKSHSQVRIVAKYMFIDSWDGETGFLKVDGRPVWLESYNHKDGDSAHGINICGNETPERRFGRTIDVTVPHTGSSITLSFGSTTDEHPCDESFGVGSVMVFVR